MTLAPLRAPKRYSAAIPIPTCSMAERHGDGPLDQVPERFMTATLIPIAVTDGIALTAKTESSAVRESCPMDIHSAGESQAPVHRGQTNHGDQR
ncbi:hypothetical protein E4U13_003688 [Claviceps humidiphila]|uniref:Uncharacterized protein n=1 Tax=Claviceps humidiphila TaxID=1294629 RepID=A0A9P7PZI7_9HYPO|nr:hypothetical protein E4U13_003688 [Claviceps humidiphila]